MQKKDNGCSDEDIHDLTGAIAMVRYKSTLEFACVLHLLFIAKVYFR